MILKIIIDTLNVPLLLRTLSGLHQSILDKFVVNGAYFTHRGRYSGTILVNDTLVVEADNATTLREVEKHVKTFYIYKTHDVIFERNYPEDINIVMKERIEEYLVKLEDYKQRYVQLEEEERLEFESMLEISETLNLINYL